MKFISIPIFTEEYKIEVLLCNKEQAIKKTSRLFKYSKEKMTSSLENCRGKFWDCFPKHHPIIWVDSDLAWTVALATLAHEASHAMDCINEFIGMDDKSGEFKAHGISAVMRRINKELKTKKK